MKYSENKREQSERENCPACVGRRLHTTEEFARHHPAAGHGYVKEHGWTLELLAAESSSSK